MKSVFESSFAHQAQMIFNLLQSAGIPARLDGAFLQGIGGEVPMGNTVRVRVAPERETEARDVIAEWERAPVPTDAEAEAQALAAGVDIGD
jgi:hypothetical protein